MSMPRPGRERADAVLRQVLNGVGLTLPPGWGQSPPAEPAVPVRPDSPVAPQDATPRHTAPQFQRPPGKTNPTGNRPRPARPLKPVQLTAARLLLQGQSVTAVAATLRVNRYTVSRWKNDPRFQAELRRQVERATLRHAAPQGATLS